MAASSILIIAVSKCLFVVIWQLAVLGWVISDLLSAMLSAAVAMLFVRLPRIRVTRNHIRETIHFAGPMIPHRASMWAVISLSRPALAAVSTLTQVGLLSFGLNLASVTSLVLAEVNRAVLPRYSREEFPAPTGQTRTAVKWQLLAAFVVPALVGCGVAVAGPWLFPKSYWPSFSLTGVLLIGQAAYGLYLIPMNYLTQTAGRPKFSSLASGAGAVLIFASILTLGQRYGAVAVAYATAVGFVAMAVIAMVIVVVLKLDIAWSSWLAHWPETMLGAGGLACSVAALAAPVGSTLGRTLAGACLVLVLGALSLSVRHKDP